MSWIDVPAESHFPLQNLPYGIFSTIEKPPRVGVAIGDFILDLAEVAHLFTGELMTSKLAADTFAQSTLNAFMALSPAVWSETRKRITQLLSRDCQELQGDQALRSRSLVRASNATLHLPAAIGDYTDFYASEAHATNVGKMFRPNAEPLLPNWKHLPVAYHGRASSICPSGTPIVRPLGQTKTDDQAAPTFGPCKGLDFELEMGIFIGGPENKMGSRVPIERAQDRIFGFVLLNDWSARDVQKWEYIPLGPFLSKNFATTISPWVVPLEALQPCLVANTVQSPQPLAYLQHSDPFTFDINLSVSLKADGLPPSGVQISKSNFKHLYWTAKQMVAHHSVTGCNLRPGDLLGSGTISGPDPDSLGCLLEMTWAGTRPLDLGDGKKRVFLQDGDEVTLTGYAQHPKDNVKIGFGTCTGKILPAI